MKALVIFSMYLTTAYGGRNYNDSEALIRNLFKDYIKIARPQGIGKDGATEVEHGLGILKFLDFNKNVLTIDAWPQLYWQDKRLVWDPKQYSDITYIAVPFKTIWVPDIFLYNGRHKRIGKIGSEETLIITSEGRINFDIIEQTDVYCEDQTAADQFNCTLIFGSWGHDIRGIRLKPHVNKLDEDLFTPKHDWNLLSAEISTTTKSFKCCPSMSGYDELRYKLTFTTNHSLQKKENSANDYQRGNIDAN